MSEDVQLREQRYVDPRPPGTFDRYHEQVRRGEANGVYEAVRLGISPYVWLVHRCRQIGVENVPGSGPLVLAPNHFSFLDHFLMGCHIRRRVHFMAKSQLFKGPATWVYRNGGVYPVRRGVRDEEAFKTTEAILARGGTICMYCEGGRSRTGKLSERAKPGIGRIALESGATIVPVAIYGSSKVRNWKRFSFPRVTVQFGEPMAWPRTEDPTREQQQAVADEILGEIRGMYAGLEREGRKAVKRRVREERAAHGHGVA